MMEMEYKREMNRNYMVIRPKHEEHDTYTIQMLRDNSITGFLPFYEKWMNGKQSYYYDITSKQPLERMLQHRNLTGDELFALMSGILLGMKQAEKYLLDENQVTLSPIYLYIEPDSFQCFLCMIPGKRGDFSAEFQELSQYVLDHVNPRDGEAVVLAFSIVKECRKENFGFDDIERALCAYKPEKKRESDHANIEEQWDEREYQADRKIQGDQVQEETKQRKENRRKKEDKQTQQDRQIRQIWENNQASSEDIPSSKDNHSQYLGWVLLFCMAAIPVSLFVIGGFKMILRWKWILAAAEIVLGLSLFFCFREEEGAEQEETEEDESWEIRFEEEDLGFPAQREQTKGMFAEEENEEEEMQTTLLTARPVYQKTRKLVSVGGDLEIPVRYFPFIIGKNKSITDFCLDEPGVSRLHVKLEETEQGYLVTDLNSTNGTMVDGQLLNANETCELPLGSELTIAARTFRFQ